MFLKTKVTFIVRCAIIIMMIIGVIGVMPAKAIGMTYFVKWNAGGLNNGSSWVDAFTSLQSALIAASNGDEIWVAAGTYKPTTGPDRSISFTLKNGVAIYGGFAGIEAQRTQRDFTTNITILSGDIGTAGINTDNSYHVVIGSNTNSAALLDGFTITKGYADTPSSSGGGLYNYLGSPTLSNLIFKENSAMFGGGMYSEGEFSGYIVARPTLTNVTFINNTGRGEGGGMENRQYSQPTLTNVVFTGNTSNRSGGGMLNLSYCDATLTNVTFDNNTAVAGGGLSNLGSNSTLTNVTFSNNSSTEWAGGMDNAGPGNSTLTNVTFSGNSAGTDGGAIFNHYNATLTLTNVTVLGNSAVVNGDGVDNDNSTLIIHNSILYGNGEEIYGPATVSYSIVQGGYTGVGNLNTDPLLGSLADNGGFTKTMALSFNSPAIDTGNNATCASMDQRGVTRPQGANCDIGAYEVDKTSLPLVTTANDSGPGSLRQAITDAPSGAIINFDFSLTGKTIRLITSLTINKDLIIDGSALSQNIKLDGASSLDTLIGTDPDTNPHISIKNVDFINANRFGIYQSSGTLNVTNGNFIGNDIGIQNEGNLTLINSSFSNNGTGIVNFGVIDIQGNTFTNNGQGIYNEKVSIYSHPGNVTITYSTFKQNHRSAIHNQLGTLTISESTFNANETPYGGGAIKTDGTATILNSRFMNNTAAQSGGAIAGGWVIIEGSTFIGNVAQYGGGISGVVDVKNSTFANNTASVAGGGFAGDIQLSNSTFYNNSAPVGGGIYLDTFGTLTVHTILNNTFSNNSGGGAYFVSGKVRLFNNIMANNINGFDCQLNGSSTLTEYAGNLIENNAGPSNSCGAPALTDDPLLGPLGINGGSTQTMPLLSSSPAIDAGDDIVCPALDQRGVPRPQGDYCDIGAYEYKSEAWHPVQISQALTPVSLFTQSGMANGSISTLGILNQSGTVDDPTAYVSFQTPNSSYLGYQSFLLPQDTETRLISTMLLQINFKVPQPSTQIWTWSIYDPTSGMWINLGNSVGMNAGQWHSLVFRIRQPWRFVSPTNEIRIQLRSNNANGDILIDYEALHITYLSTPSMPVAPPVNTRRPGGF